MGGKRKPESPLQPERSLKSRRISTVPDLEELQDDTTVASFTLPEQAEDKDNAEAEAEAPSFYRAPLTKKNLRQLEGMMNSKKADTVASSSDGASSRTSNSNPDGKALSTSEQGFEAQFLENGYVAPSDLRSKEKRPANIQDIRASLDKTRESASPTNSQHDYYLDEIHVAANELAVEKAFCDSILKNTRKLKDRNYGAYPDKQWVDFDKNVGFNNGLAAPKPDITEGFRQSTFPPNIKQLGGVATLVKHSPNFVALPHFAAEFKNYGGDMRKADVQAAYDGAAMVHGRNKALQLIGEPDSPGYAAALTMPSDGRGWTIWAHHSEKDEATQKVEHFQYEVKSGRTIGFEDFKRTYKMNRNAQDWGRKESTDLRDRLQQHYDCHGIVPTGFARTSAAASKSQAASTSGKQSVVSPSGTKSAPAPSHRSSDAGSKKDDEPWPTSVQKAIPPATPGVASSATGSVRSSGPSAPSLGASTVSDDKPGNRDGTSTPPSPKKVMPHFTANDVIVTSSKQNGRQKVQAGSQTMLPPPNRVNDTPSKRDDGPKLLNRNRDTSPRRPSSDSGRLSGPRPDVSTLNAVLSGASEDIRQMTRQLASGFDKSDRRRYRDREYGIQQLQSRRSDSPDRQREPRPQDRDQNSHSNTGRRDDRSERSSVSGSSNSSSRLPDKPTRTTHKLPDRPPVAQSVKTRNEPVKRSEYGASNQANVPTSDALYSRRW